jgi:signal transduction histidine kinase
MITSELEKIIRVAAQMRLVVSGLQEYVWLQETVLKTSPVDLNNLVIQVQKELAYEFGEDFMQIQVADLPKIEVDEAQIRLLFYQLFSNAILFRKENDKAHVNISGAIIQQNIFREVPDRYQYGSFLKLEITDNGIGFDPEYREQIFELFKKLDAKGGKGIGLSLCRMVVENHSGQITAESKPGDGSTFIILLPFGNNISEG